MKILVVSDTHGKTGLLQEVLEKHKDIDVKIHCGDSELSADALILSGFHIVEGNCDARGQFQDEQIVEAEDIKIFISHGHLYKVKQTLLPISLRAKEVGAKIVCFGHSHFLGVEEKEGIIYLNPGSLNFPRGRKEGTYAIIEIMENIKISYWCETHEKLYDFQFSK